MFSHGRYSDDDFKSIEHELISEGYKPSDLKQAFSEIKKLTPESEKAVILKTMMGVDGIREETKYAYYKTGYFMTTRTANIAFSETERAEFQNAAKEWHNLSSAQKESWYQEVKEFIEKKYIPSSEEIESVTPADKQWVMVLKLENGEFSVSSRRGVIDVMNYEQAKHILSLDLKPRLTGYTCDGRVYGSADVLGNDIIHVVDREAIPRSDYNPSQHDSFHLRVNRNTKTQRENDGINELTSAGLIVYEDNPGSVFDVIKSHHDLLQKEGRHDLLSILANAHPVVWFTDMLHTAVNAANTLHEHVKVEDDVMFMNPMIWTFTTPLFNIEAAGKAIDPVTEDGHIPFPDEMVGDAGFALVGELFKLTKTEITAHYLYCNLRDGGLEIRKAQFTLGTTPIKQEDQVTLKMLRFAASPYLIAQRNFASRHIRRRVENLLPSVDKGFSIIKLRRAVTANKNDMLSKGQSDVQWSCQWWVEGHWRHQPCGFKNQDRKLLWIPPYIKGPVDKPLKKSVRLLVR